MEGTHRTARSRRWLRSRRHHRAKTPLCIPGAAQARASPARSRTVHVLHSRRVVARGLCAGSKPSSRLCWLLLSCAAWRTNAGVCKTSGSRSRGRLDSRNTACDWQGRAPARLDSWNPAWNFPRRSSSLEPILEPWPTLLLRILKLKSLWLFNGPAQERASVRREGRKRSSR